MARRASTIFAPKASYNPPDSVNTGGYPAWTRDLEERVLQVLLTNTLGNTFYADKHELLKEAREVYAEALKVNPVFFAKALAFARNNGFMRTQPIFGLVLLAGSDRTLFKQVFDKVILTPNDLFDFMTILGSERKGQGGRAVKTTVSKWLAANFSADSKNAEYWAIKYGSGSKEGYSLKDVIKTVHPTGMNANLVWYLLGKDNSDATAQFSKIANFERLKIAKTDEEKIEAIKNGKLPHEVASTFAGQSAKVWQSILGSMPTFALLRNLNTLDRMGILDKNKETINKTLTDPANVKKAKILPFRFYDAFNAVKSDWVKDTLRKSIENSVESLPEIKGSSAIMLDTSGSMAEFIKTASLFAFACLKKANGGTFYTFNTVASRQSYSLVDSILSQAENMYASGGTDIAKPVMMMTTVNNKVDNIIIVTDEQQNTGSTLWSAITQYRQKVNRDVKVFVIDVSPYKASMAPVDKNVFLIYGWGDQVINYISSVTNGLGSQITAVNNTTL
jgi:60 kDa SS-A/Ro ribonucleoprotein